MPLCSSCGRFERDVVPERVELGYASLGRGRTGRVVRRSRRGGRGTLFRAEHGTARRNKRVGVELVPDVPGRGLDSHEGVLVVLDDRRALRDPLLALASGTSQSSAESVTTNVMTASWRPRWPPRSNVLGR